MINKKDIEEFKTAKRKILKLLSDKRPHRASQIRRLVKQSEALRRLRELRKKGYDIRCHRVGDSRDYFYQLKGKKAA